MYEILIAGGWLMIPILVCSLAVITVSIERFWVLRPQKVVPPTLLSDVWKDLKQNQLTREQILDMKKASPLGYIFAAGLANASHGRDIMKDSIEEAANQMIHQMERYVAVLSTISSIAPLLGLLGTVIGMIKVFTAIMLQGSGNASVLAGGISEALITTAAGMSVAIPALIAHRFFERRIDSLVITMEDQAIRLVDALHGERSLQAEEQEEA